MKKKYFTEEEVKNLSENPYVLNVSKKAITYTEEFKQDFYAEYSEGGLPSQILRDMGFNPNVLGKQRIKSITQRCRKYGERIDGFTDQRRYASGRPLTRELSEAEEMKRLKHRIALLEQENDFLKKLEALERRARKESQAAQKGSR